MIFIGDKVFANNYDLLFNHTRAIFP